MRENMKIEKNEMSILLCLKCAHSLFMFAFKIQYNIHLSIADVKLSMPTHIAAIHKSSYWSVDNVHHKNISINYYKCSSTEKTSPLFTFFAIKSKLATGATEWKARVKKKRRKKFVIFVLFFWVCSVLGKKKTPKTFCNKELWSVVIFQLMIVCLCLGPAPPKNMMMSKRQ